MSGDFQTGNHRVIRNQILKKGGSTPEFVDAQIPTAPIRLRFGPGRGIATKGVGSAWLMGTKRLTGSPNDFSYQLTKMRITTSTPNIFLAIVHSREGTVDIPYLPARGDDLTVGDIQSPIDSFSPGTLKIYALGPGSSRSIGPGSNLCWFQGVGSNGNYAIGANLDLYAV